MIEQVLIELLINTSLHFYDFTGVLVVAIIPVRERMRKFPT